MVVSVPKGIWAGARASPVVWRQLKLPGEDSLASKETIRSRLTLQSVFSQDRKGKYRNVLRGNMQIHLTDIYMLFVRLMRYCVWKQLTYRRHLSIWRISRQIWLSQKLFQEMKKLVITNDNDHS